MIRAFYLNLEREAERRRFMQEQLAEVGIPGERIDAVDGSKPLPPELAPHFSDKHVMDVGALGCYASHIKAWQQIVNENVPVALVLEDDAILARNLASILSEVVAALPKGWDMVHLASKPDRAVCTIAKLSGLELVQYSRVPPGAVGYLLSYAGECGPSIQTPGAPGRSVSTSMVWLHRQSTTIGQCHRPSARADVSAPRRVAGCARPSAIQSAMQTRCCSTGAD